MDRESLKEQIFNKTTEGDVLKYIIAQTKERVDGALEKDPKKYILVRVCSSEELADIAERNIKALGSKKSYADDPNENSKGKMFFFNVDNFDEAGRNTTEEFEERVLKVCELVGDIHNRRVSEKTENLQDFENYGIAVLMLDRTEMRRLLENGKISFGKMGVYNVPGKRATMTMKESAVAPEVLLDKNADVFTANNFYPEIERILNGYDSSEMSRGLREFVSGKIEQAKKSQISKQAKLTLDEKDCLEQVRAIIESNGVGTVYEYLNFILGLTPRLLKVLLLDGTLDANNKKLQKFALQKFKIADLPAFVGGSQPQNSSQASQNPTTPSDDMQM